jgi:hypothetical protein
MEKSRLRWIYREERKMVRYITFCELTPEFLRMPLDERRSYVPKWTRLATGHGLKVVFWGMPIGVKENIVCVFETRDDSESFLRFEREWLGLGTPDAGRYIKNTRTITVY